MCDIIQASKRVDDVRAQHWVNILNKKLTVTRIVCSPSSYVANDNFVVRVDICTRRSNFYYSPFVESICFTQWQIFSNIFKGRWIRSFNVILKFSFSFHSDQSPNFAIANY